MFLLKHAHSQGVMICNCREITSSVGLLRARDALDERAKSAIVDMFPREEFVDRRHAESRSRLASAMSLHASRKSFGDGGSLASDRSTFSSLAASTEYFAAPYQRNRRLPLKLENTVQLLKMQLEVSRGRMCMRCDVDMIRVTLLFVQPAKGKTSGRTVFIRQHTNHGIIT